MKKLQFMAWPKLCSVLLLGAGALFMASCARDGFDNDEKWDSPVSNTQLTSPKAEDINVMPDASGNYQTFSWPVVVGTSLYECKLVDKTDPDNLRIIYEGNVDGCSLKTPKEDDAVYEFSIRTLANTSKGNKDATEATKMTFNTIIETYKIIKSAENKDLTKFFAKETIPENKKDPVTKQLIPIAYDLEADAEYTMSGMINFGYRKILIRTQKTKDDVVVRPIHFATITLEGSSGEAEGESTGDNTCFMIQHGFTLKSVKIDATKSKGNSLITMADADHLDAGVKKNEQLYPNAQNKGRNATDEPIEVRDCLIKNLKKSLFYTNKTPWAISSLNVISNVIQLNNSGSTLLDLWYEKESVIDGAVKNLLVKNNTIYDIGEESTFYFIRFANSSNAIKMFGPGDKPIAKTFVLEISNNTLTRTSVNRNFGNMVPSNLCVNNILKQNIFVDVNNLNKYALSSQDRDYADNFIWTVERTSTPDEDKVLCNYEDPGIIVPKSVLDLTKENGGLTGLTPSGNALAKSSGDPRWLPTN